MRGVRRRADVWPVHKEDRQVKGSLGEFNENEILSPLLAGAALVLRSRATPAWAHHAFAAEFDAKRPVHLVGVVSQGGTDQSARLDSCGRKSARRQSDHLDDRSRQSERAVAARFHQNNGGAGNARGGGRLPVQRWVPAGQRQEISRYPTGGNCSWARRAPARRTTRNNRREESGSKMCYRFSSIAGRTIRAAGGARFGQIPGGVPRTPDGHPDLQGIWTNATITPLERPAALAGKATLTDAEAKVLEKKSAEELAEADGKSEGPLLAATGSAGRAGTTCCSSTADRNSPAWTA